MKAPLFILVFNLLALSIYADDSFTEYSNLSNVTANPEYTVVEVDVTLENILALRDVRLISKSWDILIGFGTGDYDFSMQGEGSKIHIIMEYYGPFYSHFRTIYYGFFSLDGNTITVLNQYELDDLKDTPPDGEDPDPPIDWSNSQNSFRVNSIKRFQNPGESITLAMVDISYVSGSQFVVPGQSKFYVTTSNTYLFEEEDNE